MPVNSDAFNKTTTYTGGGRLPKIPVIPSVQAQIPSAEEDAEVKASGRRQAEGPNQRALQKGKNKGNKARSGVVTVRPIEGRLNVDYHQYEKSIRNTHVL